MFVLTLGSDISPEQRAIFSDYRLHYFFRILWVFFVVVVFFVFCLLSVVNSPGADFRAEKRSFGYAPDSQFEKKNGGNVVVQVIQKKCTKIDRVIARAKVRFLNCIAVVFEYDARTSSKTKRRLYVKY